MSTRLATAFVILALAAPVLATTPARAQNGGNVDLQAFRPAIDSRGYITVNASQILGHTEFSFGLVTNWGYRILEFNGPAPGGAGYEAGESDYTVQHIITPNLQAAVGLFKILEIGVTVPFPIVFIDVDPDFTGDPNNPNDDEEFGFSAQGIGDLGLHAKVRLLDTSRHPLGFAVLGSVFIPAHSDDEWLGENKPSFQAMGILDKEWKRFSLAANGGIRMRTSDEESRTFNQTGGMTGNMVGIPATGGTMEAPSAEVPFGVGIAYAVTKQKFDVVLEAFGSMPLGGDNYQPLEALIGIKLYLARNSFFMIGGGAGFLPGSVAGANPDARAFIGIVFEPNIGDRDGDGIKDDVDKCPDDPEDYDDFEDKDGCPEPDNDQDGILDEDDQCPNEPEDKDGIEDEDGCPEGDVLDRDGDGIPDDSDQCPDDPEDFDGFEDKDGCPDEDNDKDGILDVDDLCPNDPEDFDKWEDEDGCPELDNDKDRILDTDDACPNEPETYNGHEDTDGCPDKGRVIVSTGKIEILDKIYFETGKADIKPISFPILDAVAATLVGNPDIALVEVGGHADERGDDDYNMDLTQKRTESVVNYLVERGVDRSRLRPVGYGETKPVDPKSNPAAWAKNRRVEFLILKRGP